MAGTNEFPVLCDPMALLGARGRRVAEEFSAHGLGALKKRGRIWSSRYLPGNYESSTKLQTGSPFL